VEKDKKNYWIYFFVGILLTFFAIITGNYFTKKLSLDIGQIAPKDFYAPFQVENELATERKRKQVYQSTPVVTTCDTQILDKALTNVTTLFNYAKALKKGATMQENILTLVNVLQLKSPIPLYDTEYRTLLEASEETLANLEAICSRILTTIYEEGIQEEDTKSIEIRKELEQTGVGTTYQKLVYEIALSQVEGNIIIDEEATLQAQEAAMAEVEPVYILQGEKIVGQGGRITEEIYVILEKVGYLNTTSDNRMRQYGGVLLLLILFLLFLIGFNHYTRLAQGLHQKETTLLFILYLFTLALIRFLASVDTVYLPLSIAPMLIAILMNRRVAVICQVLLVCVASLVQKVDMVTSVYWLLTGFLALAIMGNMRERKQTLKNALTVGIFQSLMYFALQLVTGTPFTPTLFLLTSIAFIIGIVSVILVVGSLPLWEAAFGFVTPLHLLELTNPNQPLLKRLLLEATGTYYHSLLVANLAEAAADAIGANALLVRVGGYYHDIGKLNASNYFKENQGVENPHDYLDPRNSANILLSHVTGGLELAEKYKLPQCVKDIILQHHGTTYMQYFYAKAQMMEDEVIDEKDFRYPGPTPLTREAGLIMLADVVEATVRAMQYKLGVEVEIEDIVRNMVTQKITDGQLNQCPLYLSDIEKIINAFTNMLQGMYHQRVEYPPRKEN
jgi:hypothetical protein